MECDSHSTKPSSSIVGTSPVGFIFRYSGVLLTPNCRPASMRWYWSPSSSAAHSTFFTFTEFVLPQIFNIAPPKSDTEIRDGPRFISPVILGKRGPSLFFGRSPFSRLEAHGLTVAARIAGSEVAAVELPDELRAAEL